MAGKIFFFDQIIIGDLPPPPLGRQKIFGQFNIFGLKKNFSELLIANINQIFRKIGTTSFI